MNNENNAQHHGYERKIKRIIKASSYSVIFCGILMSSPFGHSQGHDQGYEHVSPEFICSQYDALMKMKKFAGKDWDVVKLLIQQYGTSQTFAGLSARIYQYEQSKINHH